MTPESTKRKARKRRASERPRVGCCEELGRRFRNFLKLLSQVTASGVCLVEWHAIRMGFWSRIRRRILRVVRNVAAGIARAVTKAVAWAASLLFNATASLLLFWATKKLRLHVCILQPADGKELISVAEATVSVERAALLIKNRYDAIVHQYGSPYIEVIKDLAPDSALDTRCTDSLMDFVNNYPKVELGEGGSFYAAHTAGWVGGIPITFTYPITVFVVRSIDYKGETWNGCSFGLLTDYIVITPAGLREPTTLTHELSHSCGLYHRETQDNLMYKSFDRGTTVTGWQKWWFRVSRHVNHW